MGSVDFNVIDISAGNGITILQAEDKKVYVLGDNTYGQIGLGDIANTCEIKEINLGDEIENISSGVSTHSGLITKDGFVWHSGTNGSGELGTQDNEDRYEFEKNGETIVITDFDKKYLDKDETTKVNARLENTFNIKVDLVDDNQDNFHLETEQSDVVSFNGLEIIPVGYGTAHVRVIHTASGVEKTIEIIVTMKMESLVQGFRDMDLADGEYRVVVKDQPYVVELINYYDDMRYSVDAIGDNTKEKTVELGDTSEEYKTLVVKYHKNLTIDEGVTLTARRAVDENGDETDLTYKKGMYICVLRRHS